VQHGNKAEGGDHSQASQVGPTQPPWQAQLKPLPTAVHVPLLRQGEEVQGVMVQLVPL